MNKKPLNIGQFIDAYYPVIDGVINVVDNYAKRMNDSGNRCTVFTSKAKGYKKLKFPYPVVRCAAISPKETAYGIPMPGVDIDFIQCMRNWPLDIAHIHSPAMIGHEMLKIAEKRNIPTIMSFHSKFYDNILDYVKYDMFTKLPMTYIMGAFEQADFVWAVSKASGEVLRDYGYKGTYEVVDNGCEMKRYEFTPEEKILFDKKYGIGENIPVFLFVGQIINHKNIKFSLDALKIAKDRGFKFKFLLAGNGYDFKDITEHAENIGLNEANFIGQIKDREELSKLYTRADVFLFPSNYDNAPIVVMESASCQTIPIAIKGSTTSEKIQDGNNGYITSDDPNDYADIIMRSVEDKTRLKQMGENAMNTIGQSYDKVVKEVLEHYHECIRIYNKVKGI